MKLTKARRELLSDIAGDEWDVYEGKAGGLWKSTKQGFVARVNRGTLGSLVNRDLVERYQAPSTRWGKAYFRPTDAGRAALKEMETSDD
jgi:hypothetical protein